MSEDTVSPKNEKFIKKTSHTLIKRTAQPCRSIMPHGVAPINAAVCIKCRQPLGCDSARNTKEEKITKGEEGVFVRYLIVKST